MKETMNQFFSFLSPERIAIVLRASLILIIGLVVAKVLGSSVARLLKKRLAAHELILARRSVFYFAFALFFISALHQLGFNLGVLLGAAGILSVAIGFASQTSASNLISGLFLIGERPFSVGDMVRVESITGEVLAIDLLSVKIRTFDNLYVRIPNETLIKSVVTTLTRFPIRRIDLQIGVAYKEDIEHVRRVLFDVADKNPLCLEEPKPLYIFKGFGDSSMDMQFSVWAKRENFLELKTGIQLEIKAAFDREGIEIPFPHRTLYTGSVTDPMPIRIVGEENAGEDNT